MPATRVLITAAVLASGVGSSFAATLLNGDFEANASDYITWPGYSGAGGNPAGPAGWTITGGVGINPVNTADPNPAPFNDGLNSGAFAFLQNSASLEQTVSDFVIGGQYELSVSFNARNCCGDFPIASVYLDDTLLASSTMMFPDPGGVIPATLANGGIWYTANLPFIATSTSHTISFRAVPAGSPNGDASLLIDNVSIRTVPEPATGLLSLVAFSGLALRRRR